ncbi:MAG: pilus assembly protein PilM [Oscillospiraceae bacterium]|nr:pilus assembly protein PilM [Oscillospiraceae bacterium]
MLSFDITDRNIRIIKGTESGGKIRISSAATLNLEEEVIVNGHVRDVPRLATLINQVLRTNKMADKEAIVSISSNMTIFKELHIQKAAKEQDFMKMVRAEMAAALGIDDSYSVSYIIVGDSDQQEGALKILATACPFEVVDCYKRVFNMLQLSLRSVMIGCNCITKVLLADTKVKSKMPLLAVQIDNNFISLNLYEHGQLSFSRFASISAEDYDDSDDYVFEAVNENIFRMLQFQKSKAESEPIENVIFYGDTREYVRLTNELEKMGIRTSIINVPPQIHGYENLEFSSYANAIGAMFKRNKETERINLLETDTVNNNKIRSDSTYTMLLIVSLVASIAVCTVAWLVLAIQNNKIQKDIDDINEKKNSQCCTDLKKQLEDLKDLQEAMNTYYDGVSNAHQAYLSRPYVLSKHYETIEKTIKDTCLAPFKQEIAEDPDLKDTDDPDYSDYYEIKTMDYEDGNFTIDLTIKAEDLPLQPTPAKLIDALRALPEVSYVDYEGYSLLEVLKPVAGTPVDEDGNPIANNAKTEPVEYINMTLTIELKGDGVTFTKDEMETKEAAQ